MCKAWFIAALLVGGFAPPLAPRAAVAAAAPALPDREAVDRLAKPLIDQEWCEGLVVGVIDERGRQVYGYGKLSEMNPSTPDGDTLFEIGSITKAFTGT